MSAQIIHFRPMADLPNRIRELRTARGLSLDKLAGMIGCSKVQLADLELGKRRLSVEWMERVARPLALDPADLLSDEHNPFRLNAEELRLIETFRSASREQKETISRVADAIVPYNHPAKVA